MDKTVKSNSKIIVLFRSLIISYVITALILFLLAFLLYKFEIKESIVNAGIIVSYILSTFIGGFLVGKGTKERRFIWGIILGLLYFVIITAFSLVMNKEVFQEMGSMTTIFIMCIGGSMLGGMVS